MRKATLDDHLAAGGSPKRILSIDGGPRAALSLAMLSHLERLIKDRASDPSMRLCDYFDLIGGTSAGAAIAAGLAIGMSVEQIGDAIRRIASMSRSAFREGVLRSRYSSEELSQILRSIFGQTALGEARTGLAIVMKRIDTGVPWVVHNSPRGKYYERRSSTFPGNREFRLSELVRASMSAPGDFDPVEIELVQGRSGLFIDGSLSPHCNPAVQLLLLASLRGYGFQWPLGHDRLLLVSIGSGQWPLIADEFKGLPAALTMRSLASIVQDTSQFNHTLMSWFAGGTRGPIDREIGTLDGEAPFDRPLLSYLRYDVVLDKAWLELELKVDVSDKEMEFLNRIDRETIDVLTRIGSAAGELLIRPRDLPSTFDPVSI
jgi:uncharacterized protein